jgi:energy-coupling factor transport system ATP-binding protein
VLATDPETIVFDEPTTGLDAAQQEQFLDLIARLNRDERLTVVMVTHDMETIARYAPRTVVLENGRKAYDGPTRDLFADPGRLDAYGLRAPHVVETANELTDDSEDEGLPALSVEELVTGLGGPGAYGGDREERSVEPASKGEDA